MTRGGRLIYAGALGRQSQKMIEYFEVIPGIAKIEDGNNPAACMLDISTPAAESTTNGISVLAVVYVERTVLYREIAAGMYSTFPYVFAQVS
ncbi:pleiotropic drug resistance 6 [Perilla frutescens var. hirtella]|nr:pleiotropic drug resistance 6 [Perilla frutescens var. hirtella]